MPVFEYKPAEVKQAISGYGNADKAQMQEMVRILLDIAARSRVRTTPPTRWQLRCVTSNRAAGRRPLRSRHAVMLREALRADELLVVREAPESRSRRRAR